MTNEDIFREIINKMLAPHGVDIDFVTKNPTINGLQWFHYYTTTKELDEEWVKWGIEFIKKNTRWSKKRCVREMNGIWGNYGLVINTV